MFTKDNFTGDFVEGWKKVLEDANLEMVSYEASQHASTMQLVEESLN